MEMFRSCNGIDTDGKLLCRLEGPIFVYSIEYDKMAT